MEAATISVRLLGGFSIRHGGQRLSSLPPQATVLLAYLIVHRDRPQTRDLLAGRFWSDLPEDRARKRLSNTLWQIRSAIDSSGFPDLVEAGSSAIEIVEGPIFEVDSEIFERQVADVEENLRTPQMRGVLIERLAALVDGYSGDFLAGHYHEWIELERDRLFERYHSAVGQLITLYKSRSQYDVALRYAQVLVKLDPLREDRHREVMRLHALMGQPAAATRQFEAAKKVLEVELRVEPSPETVELHERIRSDAPTAIPRPSGPGDGRIPMVGRAAEQGVLLGRVDELLRGSGGVVLVEGDPGIGKTCLVDELVDAAQWRSVRVLQAGHNELSGLRPYGSFQELLSPAVRGLRGEHLTEVLEPVWLQQAAEVLPDLALQLHQAEPRRSLRPSEEPTRTGEALARVVLAQGSIGPTLMVLDDVHWCDDDSMQVLVQMGNRLAASGVLLCLTYRRFEAEQAQSVWAGISKLEAMPSASRLVLGPLSPAEVRELVSSRLGPGVVTADALSRLVSVASGNPLYVLESTRYPDDPDGLAEVDDELLGLDLPPVLVQSLRQRLDALDSDHRAVLEGLAAMAASAPSSLLGRAMELDRLVTVECLARLADQGLVLDDASGRCRFAHDQTRRVVYEEMSGHRRRWVHDRILEALLECDDGLASSAQLAHHARLAGRLAEARTFHIEAAREALAVNGFRTACDHFEQADDLADELGIDLGERAADLLGYEAALDVLGRRSDQVMLLKRLGEADLEPELEGELAERQVRLLIATDRADEAVGRAVAAVERARAAGRPVGGLLNSLAVARYRSGDHRAAVVDAQAALAEDDGEAVEMAAQITLGKILIDGSDHEAGRCQIERAIARATEVGDDRSLIEATSELAIAQFRQGLLGDAEQSFSRVLQASRDVGYRWGEATGLGNLAALHIAQGRGGRALELLTEAAEVFGSLDNARGEAIVKQNSATLRHGLLGDDTTAADLATSAAVYFRSVNDLSSECLAMVVLSGIDVRRGKRRLARRRLKHLLERVTEQRDTIGEVEVLRCLAGLELSSGNIEAAADALDRVLAACESVPLDNLTANASACRAICALEAGEDAVAAGLVDRAVKLNRAGAESAHVTAWLCGRSLVRLGRSEEADEQFRLAFELLNQGLEGLPEASRARAEVDVEEHASIVEEFQRRFPISVSATLPRADAPIGRPLEAHEFVDVVWTPSDPSDWEATNPAGRRRRRLARLVREAEASGGAARLVDLAEALGVSERTIKRDLALLRSDGGNLRTGRGR